MLNINMDQGIVNPPTLTEKSHRMEFSVSLVKKSHPPNMKKMYFSTVSTDHAGAINTVIL